MTGLTLIYGVLYGDGAIEGIRKKEGVGLLRNTSIILAVDHGHSAINLTIMTDILDLYTPATQTFADSIK